MKRLGEVTPLTTPSKIATWDVTEKTPEKKRGPILPTKASPTKQVQRRILPIANPIETYVFFDLECTDLIKNDEIRNCQHKKFERGSDYFDLLNQWCLETRTDDLPHITEMSFAAISRDTFGELKNERMALSKWNEGSDEKKEELARFVPTNMHTRQINPTMNENEWVAYEKRRHFDRKGVLVHSRKTCQRNNSFKEEWPGVVQFLASLPKPAVLIGHNALKYDLRVIYGELVRNNLLQEHPIPLNVFFVDSYLMAKSIDEKIITELSTVCKYIKFPKPVPTEEDKAVIDDSFSPKNQKTAAETDHPWNFLDWEQFPISQKRRIRKEGFIRTQSGGWTYRQSDFRKYTLSALYEELVGGKFTAHYAQQDTEALLQICLSFGDDFMQYTDKFAADIPF